MSEVITEQLLDPKQVAAILNVPVSWVYSAAEKNTIPSFRVGKYRRFRKSDLEAWLQARRANGGGA